MAGHRHTELKRWSAHSQHLSIADYCHVARKILTLNHQACSLDAEPRARPWVRGTPVELALGSVVFTAESLMFDAVLKPAPLLVKHTFADADATKAERAMIEEANFMAN